jgi:hypothetical protein
MSGFEDVKPTGGNGLDTTHEKLDLIIETLGELSEMVEAIQQKVEELDLTYGNGLTIEGYES